MKTDLSEKHLALARMALEVGSYGDAAREFDLVLDNEPENAEAIYGAMLCRAKQSSGNDCDMRSVIYSYKKLSLMSGDDAASMTSLRMKFIEDFAPLVNSNLRKILGILQNAKRNAESEEAINLLNVVNRKVLLPNRASAELKELFGTLEPRLRESLVLRDFILQEVVVEEISHKRSLLTAIKNVFEIPGASAKDPHDKKYDDVKKCLEELDIQAKAKRENISVDEARAIVNSWKKKEEPKKSQAGKKGRDWNGLVWKIVIFCVIITIILAVFGECAAKASVRDPYMDVMQRIEAEQGD